MSVNEFYQTPFSSDLSSDRENEEEIAYLRAVKTAFTIAALNRGNPQRDGDLSERTEAKMAESFERFRCSLEPLLNQGWRLVPLMPGDKMLRNWKMFRFQTVEDCNIYRAPFTADVFADTGRIVCTYERAWNLRGCKPVMVNPNTGFVLYTNVTLNGDNDVAATVSPYESRFINFFTGRLYHVDSNCYSMRSSIQYDVKPSTRKNAGVREYENFAHDTMENILSCIYGFSIKWSAGLEDYLRIRAYFGNLMEAFLRQTARTPWIVDTMAAGLKWGKPCNVKSLKAFFSITQSELEMFLSQPDEKLLMFYLTVRQQEKLTVAEAERLYRKVEKMNTEYNLDGQYYRYYPKNEKAVSVKGHRGRHIMSTSNLPKYLWFYLHHGLNKYYSVSRYTKYVIEEKKLYPDMTMDDFERDLEDYNRMADEILGEGTKFILPYKLVHAHQTMSDNYNGLGNNLNQHMDSAENIMKLDKNYNDDLYVYDDPKFTVLRPMLPSDIYREGTVLCHCVGSYTGRVLSGETKILFMRKKSMPDVPYVTFELKDNRIAQQYGSHDRWTTPEERDFIDRWFKNYLEKYSAWKASGSPKKETERYKTFQKKHEEHLAQLRIDLQNIQTVESDLAV
jgi:hypothetical protein